MARIATPKILRWGTPPEPLSGWELIRAELDKRPGAWAELGPVSKATINNRLPGSDGYEYRFVKADEGKPSAWVRKLEPVRSLELVDNEADELEAEAG